MFRSEATQVRPSWPGFANLKHLVIFGDSYTDVGYNSNEAHPTLEEPLGIEFPGQTWAEDEPNWVGHLITNYAHSPLLVYDYAVGGDTVAGVEKQVERHYLPTVAHRPDWAPWKENDTLFITWIGINDCAYVWDPSEKMETLFGLQEQLYETGARNFLFIDVPPIHRTPPERSVNRTQPYIAWNTFLRTAVNDFCARHSDATVMIYSAWTSFNRILDEPVKHGFAESDPKKAFGGIWVDNLHPTTRMHDWIAKDLAEFLLGIPSIDGDDD